MAVEALVRMIPVRFGLNVIGAPMLPPTILDVAKSARGMSRKELTVQEHQRAEVSWRKSRACNTPGRMRTFCGRLEISRELPVLGPLD